jgi:hypothetical protein
MSLYEASVPQFIKMLQNLGRWLDKAGELAKSKNFDVNTLLQARLAPDQYPLVRQIQSACDSAKFPAARLAAKEPPKHPDTEQTWEEAKQRIASCISFLETLEPADFAGAEKRIIALPFLEGKVVEGSNYLVEMGLPNFYFHVTTAYDILRHNGVALGKMDYIGSLNLRDP